MPTPADRRPDPEELLRRVQDTERRESRGRLKIFLGYASRVGKSFRMFDEGRRRKERGQDVVVGAVQREVTPDIAEILSRLDVVPTVSTKHAGRSYEVMDMTALFRRHPQVCLVDGLAYDNPPGSRNPQRWQDVKELLDRGIAVISAVNIQHIHHSISTIRLVSGFPRCAAALDQR
jgi:two-component system sensor histidine kinase KdpD